MTKVVLCYKTGKALSTGESMRHRSTSAENGQTLPLPTDAHGVSVKWRRRTHQDTSGITSYTKGTPGSTTGTSDTMSDVSSAMPDVPDLSNAKIRRIETTEASDTTRIGRKPKSRAKNVGYQKCQHVSERNIMILSKATESIGNFQEIAYILSFITIYS